MWCLAGKIVWNIFLEVFEWTKYKLFCIKRKAEGNGHFNDCIVAAKPDYHEVILAFNMYFISEMEAVGEGPWTMAVKRALVSNLVRAYGKMDLQHGKKIKFECNIIMVILVMAQ